MGTGRDNYAGTRGPSRLLIVEDHPLVRAGLRVMFEGAEDLKVVGEAENGQAAIEMCRSLTPDLVLMDVSMPEMDGLEATKWIKEEQPEVSVLILTSHENPDYLLEAVRAGAAGYVLKASSNPQLMSAVRSAIAGESMLDEELAVRLIARVSEEPGRSLERPPEQGGEATETPEALANILSSREIEVLRLIAVGKTNREIAHLLTVSLSTIKTYVERIMKKLGVSDRTQAVVRALELGLSLDHR